MIKLRHKDTNEIEWKIETSGNSYQLSSDK